MLLVEDTVLPHTTDGEGQNVLSPALCRLRLVFWDSLKGLGALEDAKMWQDRIHMCPWWKRSGLAESRVMAAVPASILSWLRLHLDFDSGSSCPISLFPVFRLCIQLLLILRTIPYSSKKKIPFIACLSESDICYLQTKTL